MVQTVGDWRLKERIGEGGMGIVFRATHGVLPGEYAVKQIHPRWLGDEEVRARFIREATLSAALNHPNIVRCWIPLSEGAQIYLPMEYLEGAPLSSLLPSGEAAPDWGWAVEIIRQAAEALGYVHARGIIHRDIKPSNLFISGGRVVKVLDFGLAKQMGAQSITATPGAMGTAEYIAPELLAGERPTPAADVYALGLVLYRLIVGAPAITLPSREVLPMMRALTAAHEAGLPRPSEARPGVPTWLDDLTAEMLVTDPKARLNNGAAVAARMARVEEETRLHLLAYPTGGEPETPTEIRRRRGLFGFFNKSKGSLEGALARVAALEAQLEAAVSRADQAEAARDEARSRLEALEEERGDAASLRLEVARLESALRAAEAEAAEALRAAEAEALTKLKASEAKLKVAEARLDALRAEQAEARAAQAPTGSEKMEKKRVKAAAKAAKAEAKAVKRAASAWGALEDELEEAPEASIQHPIHWVEIPAGSYKGRRFGALWASRTPITVAQYKEAVEQGAVEAPKTGPRYNWGRTDAQEHPINGVSQAQARAFAEWVGGRLPTDEEWAYLATSRGARQRFPWGDEPGDHTPPSLRACFNRPKKGTEPVGTHTLGETLEGLSDMAGNVGEWTQGKGDGGMMSVRGGSWQDEIDKLEIDHQTWTPPHAQLPHVGFRVVRDARLGLVKQREE